MKSASRHHRVEDTILDAADRLLARDGYLQLSMDDLAREAGLSKSAVYLYFPSKPDVIVAHIDRIALHVVHGLERIAAGSAAPAEKLREMIAFRVMYRFDSVQHYPESVTDVVRELGSILTPRRQEHFAAEAKIFADVLKDAGDVVPLAPQERAAVADAVIAATNALLPFHLSVWELGRRSDIAAKINRIANMLLLGLLKPERRPKGRAA
jgi:AcrR family transcriptional regulator